MKLDKFILKLQFFGLFFPVIGCMSAIYGYLNFHHFYYLILMAINITFFGAILYYILELISAQRIDNEINILLSKIKEIMKEKNNV